MQVVSRLSNREGTRHVSPGQSPTAFFCRLTLLALLPRQFLEDRGHTLVVTSDKDGPGCELEQHLPDTDIVMSQPFWWVPLTAMHDHAREPDALTRRRTGRRT